MTVARSSRSAYLRIHGLDVSVLALAVATLIGTVGVFSPTVHFVVNLCFVAIGPGHALMGRGGRARYGTAVVLAASISVAILVSMILLYLGLWNSDVVMSLLAVPTLFAVVVRLWD